MQYEISKSLSRYCFAIVVAVFVLYFATSVDPAFAQQTGTTPKISCHLMRVEGSPDGIFTVGNLDRTKLKIELDGGEWPIERLKILGVQVPWDDPREPNVKVTVDSLSDTKQDIPVNIYPFGGGGLYNTRTLSTVVEIQIARRKRENNSNNFS